MHSVTGLLTLLSVVSLAWCQTPHVGKCPKVPAQTTLDVQKYLGEWYEIRRFPSFFESGDCIKAKYSLSDDGKVIVNNSAIVDGKVDRAIGDATIPDPDKAPAVLAVRFSKYAPRGEYKVVETDYSSYSLVFSCTNVLGLIHTENAWILSRTPSLAPETLTKLENKLASYGVKTSQFITPKQTGCEKYNN